VSTVCSQFSWRRAKRSELDDMVKTDGTTDGAVETCATVDGTGRDRKTPPLQPSACSIDGLFD
ncbi:hypothetical protein, partial [Frankia sp. CcWB2]